MTAWSDIMTSDVITCDVSERRWRNTTRLNVTVDWRVAVSGWSSSSVSVERESVFSTLSCGIWRFCKVNNIGFILTATEHACVRIFSFESRELTNHTHDYALLRMPMSPQQTIVRIKQCILSVLVPSKSLQHEKLHKEVERARENRPSSCDCFCWRTIRNIYPKKLKIWGGALNLQTKKDQRLENAGPREWQTKSQFWFWKMLTSIMVKILSLVHSAAQQQIHRAEWHLFGNDLAKRCRI